MEQNKGTLDSSFDEAYQEINGLRLCKAFVEQTVKSAFSYRPADDDVFLVSYPKCGTTWMQNILHGIFTRGLQGIPSMSERRKKMPFLELMGAEAVQAMVRPGAIKTHLHYNLVPYSEKVKYIYITRNPYDCCVSFYYHTKTVPYYSFQNGTFDQFFDMFIKGKVEYGDYFSHLLAWYEHRNDSNVLFLTYEDLKTDIRGNIKKIADFLEQQKYGKLFEENAQLVEKVEELSIMNKTKSLNADFNKWSKEFVVASGSSPETIKSTVQPQDEVAVARTNSHLVRKGIVGDWRNHFSQEQVYRMKEYILAKTDGNDVMSLWKDTDIP